MRKCDGKSRTSLGSRGDFDGSVMGLHNFLGNCQTKTGSAGLTGSKWGKKLRGSFRRHTAAVVRDADNELIQIFSGRQ